LILSRCCRVSLIVGLLVCLDSAQLRTAASPAPVGEKHAITVADTIAMTRVVGGNEYFTFATPMHGSDIAHFSPDGKDFVFILAKGNLVQGVNNFSLVLFHAADSFNSPEPDVLVQMSSSSNRDAIRSLRWLPDSDTIVFLGETPHAQSQVYAYHLKARRLEKLTNCVTSVTGYDITEDGRSLVFEAEPVVPRVQKTDDEDQEAVVIRGQMLDDVLMGRYDLDPGPQIYMQDLGQRPVAVPTIGENYHVDSSRISPNGRYALIYAVLRNVPTKWKEYQDKNLQEYFSRAHIQGGITPWSPGICFIFDRATKELKVLVDGPSIRENRLAARWKLDSSAVFLRTHLPLDVQDVEERRDRQKHDFKVKVELGSLKIQKITDDEWPREVNKRESSQVSVAIQEDINTPPKIYVSDPQTQRKVLLMDLNPQFKDLEFGKVEIVEWTDKGVPFIGGLYLPPDWTPGMRYPLIIQTHGFDRDVFSMDGISEWGSAYAARLLAARGFLVLQGFDFKDRQDKDHYNDKKQFGTTDEQAGRTLNVAAFEAAVDYLDGRGMIDRNRVGIVGFSRTVQIVTYLLTHSKYHFAAASLVDGVDAGYFQYIAYPYFSYDGDLTNGGASPFGHGLEAWLRESPSFSLGNVDSPVRILALRPSGIMEQWEWYVGLALQNKPVDFTFLLDANNGSNHLMSKPWERKIAQESMVDWFRFWLKGEEDPEETKAAQYSRWHELKRMQEGNNGGKS
jgi:dipeptidyl aminopeptidase/acylaminoacyl peptidase